jgi:hypothetical protein
MSECEQYETGELLTADFLLKVLGIEGVMEPYFPWCDDFMDTHFYIAQQLWAEREGLA